MTDLIERLRIPSDSEDVMKHWDRVRQYLLEGKRGSYARDIFESLLSHIDEDREAAADAIETLTRERDEAREALKPFAQISRHLTVNHLNPHTDDSDAVYALAGDCRRAEDVLKGWVVAPPVSEIDKLRANMALRDKFLVDNDMWNAFVASLPSAAAPPVPVVEEPPMDRSQQFRDGFRNAHKRSVTWLHDRAKQMNDPHATVVLNSAAFDLGLGFLPFSGGKPE